MVFGQESLIERANNKWSVGFSYAPGISSKLHQKSEETFKHSLLSGGLQFRYNISGKYTLRSGIELVDRGFGLRDQDLGCLLYDVDWRATTVAAGS